MLVVPDARGLAFWSWASALLVPVSSRAVLCGGLVWVCGPGCGGVGLLGLGYA